MHNDNGHDLLTDVDGITDTKADALLTHFGHGYWVAQSACRYWGEIEKVHGFSEDAARTLFDRMQDADVWDALNDEGMLLDAVEKGITSDGHGGGY